MRRALAILSTVALLTGGLSAGGCSHAVIIDSDPPGAEIKVNGEKIGTAPVTYNETTGWEKVYDVEATKAGYKPTRRQLKQTEWNMPVTIASGVGAFLCIYTLGLPPILGLFWARQLPDRVVVQMEKGGPGTVEGAPPPSSYGY
jgi:hypothetical protein